jgi:hypothetical protein
MALTEVIITKLLRHQHQHLCLRLRQRLRQRQHQRLRQRLRQRQRHSMSQRLHQRLRQTSLMLHILMILNRMMPTHFQQIGIGQHISINLMVAVITLEVMQ